MLTQKDSLSIDTVQKVSNSNPYDTVDINIKDDEISSPVTYRATDSIVYDIKNKMLYLYGDADMQYDQTQVNSEHVEFDWNTQTLTAVGIDSSGKNVGTPVLVQEGKTYEANKMEYNFKTQKGRIFDVVTEDNGAFIHSEIVKKNEKNEWLSYKAKYTTCNDKEHPHFYIQARKAKIIPDKVMVSGPANLVISGINTPLALPFALFPIKSGRRSGLIIPQFGAIPGSGYFFAKEGGYYWAVSDYLSLAFVGEIVTNGTFGVKVASKYKKRYKYDGNLMMSYRRVMPSDPIRFPDNVNHDYRLNWTHRMDSKADPNNNFSANVDVASNSYNKNAIIQTTEILEVALTSHLKYVRKFSGMPFTLSISAGHNQNNRTNKFSITLPELAFNVSKITPFKRKISSSKKKIYEKIGFTYSLRAKATATAPDTTFFTKSTLDEINYGMIQNARIDAPINFLKYFTFTPSINYNERWYFKREKDVYLPQYISVGDTALDTTFLKTIDQTGFFANRDFNVAAVVQTNVTGIYNFNKGNVKGIRHILKPRISYLYRPDFSDAMWGYYDTYTNEETGETRDYNQFRNSGVYGSPGAGEQNTVTLAINNSFDMKVLNKKDTANMYKKIPVLKSLNFSTGYNFAADSLNIQNINISASTSFLNNLFGLRSSVAYTPYSVNTVNQKVSKFYWNTHQKILRFVNFDLNVDFNISGKPKAKKKILGNEYGTVEEQEYVANNSDLYYDFNIPWSFRASYHINVRNGYGTNRDTTAISTNSINLYGDVNITPKWKISLRTSFDFKRMDLGLTNLKLIRDLHCWEMSLDWRAYPIKSQSFVFEIKAKSSLLQDLKLTRKQPNYTNSSF